MSSSDDDRVVVAHAGDEGEASLHSSSSAVESSEGLGTHTMEAPIEETTRDDHTNQNAPASVVLEEETKTLTGLAMEAAHESSLSNSAGVKHSSASDEDDDPFADDDFAASGLVDSSAPTSFSVPPAGDWDNEFEDLPPSTTSEPTGSGESHPPSSPPPPSAAAAAATTTTVAAEASPPSTTTMMGATGGRLDKAGLAKAIAAASLSGGSNRLDAVLTEAALGNRKGGYGGGGGGGGGGDDDDDDVDSMDSDMVTNLSDDEYHRIQEINTQPK